nr:recombinase zinc beta ribbon domain-containing protein [Saccharothrix ecbatanensis]
MCRNTVLANCASLGSTAQTIKATRPNAHPTDPDGGETVYLLAGRLHCGVCGRKMDSHRSHGRAAYRCRHGHTTARTQPAGAPRNLYLREDHLLPHITAHLTTAGLADNPDPEQTARLIDELGLAFRCDATGVTLLDRGTIMRARTPRRRPTPQPVHHMHGNEDRGRTGRQLLLALSYKTASEADQPDTPTSHSDAKAREARPIRHPHQAHTRPSRPATPQRHHHRPRIHGAAFNTARFRDASHAPTNDPPPYDHPDSHGQQDCARKAGRRPLLLPAHRHTTHEQRSTGRFDAMTETRNPTTQPS